MNHEPTNGELLAAIQGIGNRLDTHIEATDKRFDATDARIDEVLDVMNRFATHVESEFASIRSTMATKTDLAQLEQRLERKMAGLETRVVTKDYLHIKLADLRGEFVTSRRR